MHSQLFPGREGAGAQPTLRYGRHSEDKTWDYSKTMYIFYKLEDLAAVRFPSSTFSVFCNFIFFL